MEFLSDFHVVNVSFKIFDHLRLFEIGWDILVELVIWKFDPSFFRSVDPKTMVEGRVSMTVVFYQVGSQTSPLTTDLRCSFVNLSRITFKLKQLRVVRIPGSRGCSFEIRIRVTQTLTSIELSLERAPQVKIPEGPDPMTKTFLPIFSIPNI